MQLKIIVIMVVMLIISSLVGSTYYYKSQYEKAIGELKVVQMERDSLKAAVSDLKNQAAKAATEMNGYISAMDKLSESNLEMNQKLGDMRNKLARHKLLNLRNGRHSELVLKVINRSIVKTNDKWMKTALPVEKKPTAVKKSSSDKKAVKEQTK